MSQHGKAKYLSTIGLLGGAATARCQTFLSPLSLSRSLSLSLSLCSLLSVIVNVYCMPVHVNLKACLFHELLAQSSK